MDYNKKLESAEGYMVMMNFWQFIGLEEKGNRFLATK